MDNQTQNPDLHPPAAEGPSVGRPVRRLEDERLLRGGSRYVSDLIATSDALRVKILRSPHAHARILAVGATAARAMPGVVAVLTADDLAGVGDLPREGGDVERAFAEAEVVVRRRLTNNRVAPAPLEGRVVLSEFDPASGRLVHHTASQLPHVHARSLGACLGLPLRKLQLVAPDIGGGFGAKLCFYAEDVICAILAMRTGRLCA